jgi:type IV pilus assembly protein PilB
MKIKYKGREVDFRVSTLPTLFGEKVVMRLLDKSNLKLDMSKLGFATKALADFEAAIRAPYGMILVTGPTGSGKTTTLYSALDRLNQPETNIMTAEDPVEFNIKGINQVQIRENIGLNFAAALRSFLRQDPDVIMVGEIRDFETAEIAVKAALTGHLVLSTLHTNDAPSAITRLLNMGIEPFLVASSVILILAQRLLRRICVHCKAPLIVLTDALVDVGFTPEQAASISCYKGNGCEVCSGTGYRGRIAIYEVMTLSPDLRDMVLRGGSALEIKREAIQNGMRTLRMSGLEKLKEGITTIEEVMRVTFKD